MILTAATERVSMDEARLREALMHSALWTDIRVIGRTGSTNADVVKAAREGAPEGFVVVAEEQTAGRGRLGRTWVSPPRAGLAASLLFRPRGSRELWGWLPLLAGVAVSQAVEQHASFVVSLKWPNDILLGTAERKVGGILAEVADDAVVLGIGLNVTTQEGELPVDAPYETTSLQLEGAHVDRTVLLADVLKNVEQLYGVWTTNLGNADVSGLRQLYRERCATLGKSVRVSLSDGVAPKEGMPTDVDGQGRLIVTTTKGDVAVTAGDVTHLRMS